MFPRGIPIVVSIRSQLLKWGHSGHMGILTPMAHFAPLEVKVFFGSSLKSIQPARQPAS
jgi:hypothetical protein